jgi:integrase
MLRSVANNGRTRPGFRMAGAAGVHDLRHSSASIAVSRGDGLYLAGKVRGHVQSRTTECYAHLKEDPLRAAGDRRSESIAAIMRGSRGTKVAPVPSPKATE